MNYQEAAICHVFLMDGFNEVHEYKFERHPEHGETYELHSGMHSGYIGIVADFALYAQCITDYLEQNYEDADYPGVFHYEVTEELGAWLFYHPEHLFEVFRLYAYSVIDNWFKQGDTAPSGAAVITPSAKTASTADRGSTMKLQELIKALKAERDAITAAGGDGKNVDVMVRGSKPKSVVNITRLKSAKNAARGQFLVIDKHVAETDA